ncbi:PREDICTED: putative F-box/FBD/LRR-repeat protein At4g03220 isoform X1 [Fragaria vesca subsp. vesca]|uniref:putative F-box/FBD/LRR-repeat protein At4g03220 isoform X1 n=1 Tax=Fragaria vesca subsp. vesca TaxID=101020 RepID=UPI0002C3104C|nr:PREDICTED: putative F-box/FBD/LRR-repeat protein At4g03220 isoform X1 [Fragaria vesca subsp. vesca]XP_011467285.1 PREDICTED: putative F-box/FBD/LRR-repeat protein At4g03220 isoform X1 [Fragaria vesca subsp. vesca]
MASKPKKRAIAGCEGEGGGCSESKSMIDRLSDPPDQVAHHILSFLTVVDLVRLCCVSKRWRELSLSAPCLNFDDIPSSCRSTCYDRLQLMTYLERFLFHRGDNKVQSFHVNWERHYMDENETVCICSSEHYRLLTWINCAVRCNVEVLDLKMALYDPEEAPFPSSVFLCGTLKSLVVDMNFTLLRTPSFGFSSNLSKLQLKDVVIEDERFFKWISCSCKFIQELHLDQVRGIETISIASSSLKIFRFFDVFNTSHLSISGEKLEDIVVGWYVESPSNSSLNICAPNLKVLSWSGKLMNHLSLGKFRCLEAAVLRLRPDADEVDKVYEVLCSLCKVRALMLDEATIKAPFSKGSMRAPISNIHCLTMDTGRITDELVPAIASLFKGLPNLYILCVQYKPPLDGPQSNTSGFDMGYWKLQNLAFIDQLKVVSIELCNDSNVIDLARYILECAQNLLQMIVISPPQDSDAVTKKLMGSKIVSGATVVYREREKRG